MSVTKDVKKFYAGNRKHYPAKTALSIAKQQAYEWHNWDALEQSGLVKLEILPDDCCCYEDLAGDCFDIELNADSVPGGARTIIAQKKAFKAKIEQDGVWGYEISVKCPCCGGWKFVDSCWGFVGEVDEEAILYGKCEAIKIALA